MLNGAPTSVISRCGWQMLLLCRMCIRWLSQPPTGTCIFMTCQHQFTHHYFIFVVSVAFVIKGTYSFCGCRRLRTEAIWDLIMETVGSNFVEALPFVCSGWYGCKRQCRSDSLHALQTYGTKYWSNWQGTWKNWIMIHVCAASLYSISSFYILACFIFHCSSWKCCPLSWLLLQQKGECHYYIVYYILDLSCYWISLASCKKDFHIYSKNFHKWQW